MSMRVREDYKTLTGTEKAAIFMLALGEDYTAKIFEHMDDEEILELSQTMATLGRIDANVVERLFVDFAEQMSGASSLIGTQDSTERLLAKAGMSPDKIESIMEEIRGPAGRTMWEKCQKFRPTMQRVSYHYYLTTLPWKSFTVCSAWKPCSVMSWMM